MAAIALPERLTDLDVDSPPEDRKPLVWDEASGRWVQQSFNPGTVVIGDDMTGGLADSGLAFNNVATTDQVTTAIDAAIGALGTAAAEDVGTAAGNVPQLDGSGKILTSVLPAIAITDTFVVASQAAMLALVAEVGDVAVRTDLNKSFILKVNDPAVLANWQELLTPTDTVLSVNGQTGVVVLSTTNIAEGANLYYTDARVSTYMQSGALSGIWLASSGGNDDALQVSDGGISAQVFSGGRAIAVMDGDNADRITFRVLGTGEVRLTSIEFWDTVNETFTGLVEFADTVLTFGGLTTQVSVPFLMADSGVIVPAGSVQVSVGWLQAKFPGAGATAVDGLILENPTDANGTTTVQWAPVFRSRARAWKTNATAASHTSDWRWVNAPTSGAAAITGVYKLQHSNNGAAYTDSFIFNEAGDLTILRDFSCRDSTPRNVVASRRVIAGTVTLTDGATVNIDASLGNSFELTAAGNRTIAAPTNATNNHVITIVHLASGGARTPTFDTGAGGFAFTDSVSAAIATASGKITVYTCRYTTLGGLNKWLILGAATQS